MTAHLLDANVLIALTVAEHEHHRAAAAWAGSGVELALCPVVEGALVRFLVRLGESPSTAQAVLSALYASGRCAFWPDATSYADTPLDHVVGHRQVTDAYLLGLAASRGARLVTFDRALAEASERVDLLT
ncbi:MULTISPECIES: TA system VapC family ribonuclease toxin [Aeromicrobium]|uniref:TA system VapC family ribonuclease toxin n=1 Tax=Aeromicrobium TaxID=2040 RepID=UPI00257DCE46|nr:MULTISPECIES: TA system VapC family ribonuclease toxin [Aeromicrobium]